MTESLPCADVFWCETEAWKGQRFLHIAWGIQQKLELSKPGGLCNPLLPHLSTTAEGAWLRAELQPWPGGWGRKNMGSIGKEVQLYPVPICFPSFPKNKKIRSFYLFAFISHYTMSSPCLWRINSSIHRERKMGLPTKPPLPEQNTWDYNCSCYWTGSGFCVCLVL